MSLAAYLQHSFLHNVPNGWRGFAEHPVFSDQLKKELGFCPRVDVMLERLDGRKRIWVEFEISRADPGANHLKFAVHHVFSPQPDSDTFVSMVSNHVPKGRSNLGASAILLMRRVGMNAFQTPLLPQLSGARVKELNHLSIDDLAGQYIDSIGEMERALLFADPFARQDNTAVFYAGNELEVSMNVREWNKDVRLASNADSWGLRTITYFVHDSASHLFAPSKFCAFVPVWSRINGVDASEAERSTSMTVSIYCALDQAARRFDGGVAQSHLQRRLGYRAVRLGDFSKRDLFLEWLESCRSLIRVRNNNPVILTLS